VPSGIDSDWPHFTIIGDAARLAALVAQALSRIATLASEIMVSLRQPDHEIYDSERQLRGWLTQAGIQRSTSDIGPALTLLESTGRIERPEVKGRGPDQDQQQQHDDGRRAAGLADRLGPGISALPPGNFDGNVSRPVDPSRSTTAGGSVRGPWSRLSRPVQIFAASDVKCLRSMLPVRANPIRCDQRDKPNAAISSGTYLSDVKIR
jgi:hypothetical protein